MMVQPQPSEDGNMADGSSCVPKERAWTLWSVWSRDIHDKLEVHFKYKHRMYSSLHIATMFRDKISMTPIPVRMNNTEDVDGVPPFLLLKVTAIGEFDLQKLDIQADEMKFAENAKVMQPTAWELVVHRQLGTVLLDILKVDDYLILWGGYIDPSSSSVELNNANSPPCYIIIYRHDGIYTPQMIGRGEYKNPCAKEAVDNLFFRGTAGEDVTIVQRIEPKSIMSTVWETVEVPAQSENGEGERADVAGNSRRTPRTIKREPEQQPQGRRLRSRQPGRRAGAEEEGEIDLVDLSADEDDKIPEAIPLAIPIEEENEDLVEELGVDVNPVDLEEEEHHHENPNPEFLEQPYSQGSEDDFPFPELAHSAPKKNTFSSSFSFAIPEVVLYDDSDHESEDEIRHIPIVNESTRSSPELFDPVDEEPVLPSFDTAGAEMSTDAEPVTDTGTKDKTTSETEEKRHRNASDSDSSVKSASYRLIEQELAILCRSSEEDMEVDDDQNSANTNAKILKKLAKTQMPKSPSQSVPSSQFAPLSQDFMVDPQSQLFNDIEDLVSQEMELQGEPAEAPVPADLSTVQEEEAHRNTLNHETEVDKNEHPDSDSSCNSDDSEATAVVPAAETVLKQLYEVSGVGKFHLHGRVHAFHEIRDKKQIILRVSDGTLIPFATRKGFPMPSSGDVSLTLQVDILAQNCSDDFKKKVKAAQEMSTEMVVLSYVKLEKVKRKLFALSMDVAEASDLSFGKSIPKEKESTVKTKAPARSENETTVKSIETTDASVEQPVIDSPQPVIDSPQPDIDSPQPDIDSSQPVIDSPQPGPSSGRSLHPVTVPISETPQVDPNAAVGAKRRLTFEAPAPSKPRNTADNPLHQELFKKYKLRPLNVKLLALKGIKAGSGVLLTDKFFEDNPQARAPDDAALADDDEVPSSSQSKSRTDFAQSKKKTIITVVPPTPEKVADHSNESDENTLNEKEVEAVKEQFVTLSARMGIPFVEERSFPTPPGSKSKKPTTSARNTKKNLNEENSEHSASDEDDVPIQKLREATKSQLSRSSKSENKDQQRPSSSRKVRRSKFDINSDRSSGSDKSDDSEDERVPLRKTRNTKEKDIPTFSLLSDSEEEVQPATNGNTKGKSSPAKTTAKPSVVDVESEPEDRDTDVVEEDRESPPPVSRTATSTPVSKAAVSKKKYTAFGSDSDLSEIEVEEPNKASRTTAAPGETKAKKTVLLDSESEKSDEATNPDKKNSVSPAKKVVKPKSNSASSDSDAILESETSDTSAAPPPRRTRSKPAAPLEKTKLKSKPGKGLSDDDSEAENEAKATRVAKKKSASPAKKTKPKSKSSGAFSDSDASLELEKAKTPTPARKTSKKAASPSPAKKAAAKAKSKSGGSRVVVEIDSESEQSDTFVSKTKKKAASPAKKTKPKAKYGGPLTDTDSESEIEETSSRKKRKKSASPSPAKKTKAKSKPVYDSGSESETSTVRRNLRKRQRPPAVPVRKVTRGQASRGQSIVVEISSDSEKSDTPSPVKQPKKRARAYINRSPETVKKAASKKKGGRK